MDMTTHAASRTILATPRAIFRVLLDGEAMANWRPPAGMSARIEHFDPRPGGGYRMVLTYPDDGREGARRMIVKTSSTPGSSKSFPMNGW